MSKSSKPISPLRQRMIDDMTMRNLKPATQTGYIRAVRRLNEFLGSSPANATAEDLRLFQLHLSQTGTSAGTINATVSGLRFFFETTLSKPEVLKNVTSVHEPRRLPIVPSRKDVTLVIDSAGSLKYKAAFSIAYGAGLRTNEVVHLKVSDIDSDRMVLRVDEGKGDKDRYAMLSPSLLKLLRQWYRHANTQRKMLPGGWLFPGQNPVNPMSNRQLNRAIHFACNNANIKKHFTMHGLRHAFATHLLEDGVDIRVIQTLLGHAKLEHTARYTQVATTTLRDVKGPLEHLSLQPEL
jgi:site-specific recombinase XerD